jgi:MIP family channel proteins
MTKSNLLNRSIAEALGTFALVFAGCGTLMVAERFPGTVPAGAVPAAFAFAIGCSIYALGHISGAHFNPAVSLGLASVGNIKPKELLAYWAAQFAGALLAIAVLSAILPAGSSYGATLPAIGAWQAVGMEAVLTFFLVLVISAVATDKRFPAAAAGIAIGGTILFDALLGGPVTGASMNPARSLAPALWQGQMGVLWIYLVGPALGGLLAAQVYRKIR